MSLATKYRPKTFDDVVEQPIIVNSLKNMCHKDKLEHRNLLLVGSAGTGKTTLARIVGNELNGCESDPIEIDAASNNGVENMREIVQQAKSFPIGMKYKIIIVDECHALSNAAWQSLLKVLEESPAKTVFIFCTTNPEKIPDTIISRLKVYRLSKISIHGIYNRLVAVLNAESVTFDQDAAMLIAKLAGGGMRDALTMLDNVLSYTDNVTVESVRLALNLPDYDDFFKLLCAYSKHDNAFITELLDSVYNGDSNFITWLSAFQAFVMNVLKYIYLKDINKTSIPDKYEEVFSSYGEAHAMACIRLSNVLLQLLKDIQFSDYQLELALSYLCRTRKEK